MLTDGATTTSNSKKGDTLLKSVYLKKVTLIIEPVCVQIIRCWYMQILCNNFFDGKFVFEKSELKSTFNIRALNICIVSFIFETDFCGSYSLDLLNFLQQNESK